MKNKQTAVEWLVNQIWKLEPLEDEQKVIEQAKQMEAEQLNQACYHGYYTEELYDTRNYYKDTYGK